MNAEAIDAAFRATSYRVAVTGPERVFDLRIASLNPAFDAFLRRQGASRWGIITPCNPGAKQLAQAQNQARQTRFLERVGALGWSYFNTCNVAEDSDWPPEPGCLLLQAEIESLRRLANEFGQLAFVFGEAGSAPRLVWV